ncbi:MAG: MBL fold metallo-hydrolase [Actinomycetota bacterium]|nr:MBL fold metallo-hydrolase [Actinomycetota bacterium]
MIYPFVDEGLGNSSYLVDLGDGSALVVDPFRDPRPYLHEAVRRGLRVRFVAETHLHADFVSGARELAHDQGATVLASAGGRTQFDHRPLHGGDEFDLGGLTLRVLATPGHTPEHISFLFEDQGPIAVFTGGALIVGGVARTDLISPEQTVPLARSAWRSVHEQLLTLPNGLQVYPTHGSGSFCSAGPGDERTTTIGAEKRFNPLLGPSDEDEFVRQLVQGLGSFPPYFLRLREVNRRGPTLYGTKTPPLAPLRTDQVDRVLADGGVLVDARPIERFGAGHVPGAVSLELRPQFGVWLGWLIEDFDTPLVFVVDSDQDRDALVRQCLQVGFENLVGELAGGIAAWRSPGRPLARTSLTDQPTAGRALLDVRQRNEWNSGHIPGATHLELGALSGMPVDLLPRAPLLTHCVHGQRAMTAASLLERAGCPDVAVFTGGPEHWAESTGQTIEAP